MRFLGSFAVMLAVLVVSANQASAQAVPACTERQFAQLAKLLANRQVASLNLAIAEANVALEQEHQARRTAALEEKYGQSMNGISSFIAPVQPGMRTAVDKAMSKLRAARARESASAVAAKQRVVTSARAKFDRAFAAVTKSAPKCTY